MPFIDEYKCNKCGFALPEGWGMYFYVIDDDSRRVMCGHPGEWTGFNSHCVCLDCLHQFIADLGESGWNPFEDLTVATGAKVRPGKDKRECPRCNSLRVKTVFESVGEACPKCKEGVIEQIWTGRIS